MEMCLLLMMIYFTTQTCAQYIPQTRVGIDCVGDGRARVIGRRHAYLKAGQNEGGVVHGDGGDNRIGIRVKLRAAAGGTEKANDIKKDR